MPVALSECYQCTVRVLSFSGLNPFLTYCCAGGLQFASCTVRVLPMYCQSTFLLWAELFLDLLLCRRVAVRQLHCQSALFLWAELFLDLLLCRRVTVCQLHRSTSWCLVFSFLPRSCFCCQIYQLFFWFIFTLKFIFKTV